MNEIDMSPEIARLFKRLAKIGIKRHDEEKPLYKYVTVETASKILSNHSMKFSSRPELNDNDLEMCLVNMNRTLKDSREDRLKAFKKLLTILHKRTFTDKEVKKYLLTEEGKTAFSRVTNEQVNKTYFDGYDISANKVGLCCLTTTHNNERMWAGKYGDFNKGVCIEYKFPSLFNEAFYTLTVNYDPDMEAYDLFDVKGKQKDFEFHRWLFTKRIDYAFENEVRMMSNHGEFGIKIFPKEVFTGIYYGTETTQKDIDELESLIKKVGYSFNKGVKAAY